MFFFFTEPNFSPDFLSGLQLWFDANDPDTIVKTDTNVDLWKDKSGKNRHATSTSSARPTTGVTTLNGRNVLDFDGGDTLIIDDFSYNLSALTVFVVVKHTNNGTEEYLISHYDTASNQRSWGFYKTVVQAPAVILSSDGTIANTITRNTTDAYTATDWSLVDFYYDGAIPDADFQINTIETPETSATPPSSLHNSTAKLVIGGRYVSGALATQITGSIAEILVYDAALSAADRRRVNYYLLRKWGFLNDALLDVNGNVITDSGYNILEAS